MRLSRKAIGTREEAEGALLARMRPAPNPAQMLGLDVGVALGRRNPPVAEQLLAGEGLGQPALEPRQLDPGHGVGGREASAHQEAVVVP